MTPSGNALFLILIAVALFAALSYAVTQSGRGSGNISKETAILDAARLVQYASSIENTVNKLMLLNGCGIEDISFANSTESGYEHTPAAPTECQVFHPQGGGATFETFDSMLGANGFSRFTDGNNLEGTSTSDLILIVNDISSLETCNQINKNFNAPTLANGNPLTETGSQRSLHYTGSFITGWTYTVSPPQTMPNAFCIIQGCYTPSGGCSVSMNAFVYNLHTN